MNTKLIAKIFLLFIIFHSPFSYAKHIWIDIPTVGKQNDNWSCGPNSASRVLRWYGINTSYSEVKGKTKAESYLKEFNFGTTPHVLRDIMRDFTPNVRLKREADFSDIINLLNDNIPVIVLRRVGTIGSSSFGVPSMHWSVVIGYDDEKREIYIHDTNDGIYKYSFEEFNKQWNFHVGGLPGVTFNNNGILPRSMIWIEKPEFSWSQAGPIEGMQCTRIYEDADPHAWNDNYLCSSSNVGLAWSQAGSIGGMKCTRIYEDADPHAWNDNYLCVPQSSPVNFRWSQAGSISGMKCTRIYEDADPHAWSDNYLCY